jgi:uncharacterized damage-inducible protein DinB
VEKLSPHTASLLLNQLDSLPEILGAATAEDLCRRPASGKWSAHENLAHLLRLHEVMIERIRRILSEDEPTLDRYSAEGDPDWPRYVALPTNAVLDQLRSHRQRLVATVQELKPDQTGRLGVHSRMGPMPLSTWLEFFLVHEGHHLYLAFLRARGA